METASVTTRFNRTAIGDGGDGGEKQKREVA